MQRLRRARLAPASRLWKRLTQDARLKDANWLARVRPLAALLRRREASLYVSLDHRTASVMPCCLPSHALRGELSAAATVIKVPLPRRPRHYFKRELRRSSRSCIPIGRRLRVVIEVPCGAYERHTLRRQPGRRGPQDSTTEPTRRSRGPRTPPEHTGRASPLNCAGLH